MSRRPLERDAELDLLGAALASAQSGTGALVVIEGVAGIGKTALLDAASAEAAARGMTVLRAHGSELELRFSFGVALQLFEPAFRSRPHAERAALLEGAAALAAPLFDPRATPAQAGDFSLLHGLYWFAANLADRRPVLLTIDDAHWADVPSLRFLHYLSQRIEDLPLVLAAARRTGETHPAPDLLAGLFAHPRARHVVPSPLSPAGVAGVVAETLGDPGPRFVSACLRLTEGNPYLLRELLVAARAERLSASDADASRLAELVPEGVLRSLSGRLARLPDPAAQVARSIAILSEDASLRHAAALAGLDLPATVAAADALVAADVLAPGEPLAFRHPLVAASVYAQIPDAERGLRHLRAAHLLRDAGLPAERLAAHLVMAPPTGSAWVVDELRAAADRALGLGAPDAAVTYLRRALDERPGGACEGRAELLLALGLAEGVAGLPTATERLAEAARAFPAGRRRADALAELGRVRHARGDFAAARAAFREALAVLPPEDEALAIQLEAEEALAAALDPGGQGRVRAVVEGALARPADQMTAAERTVLATVALHETIGGATPHEDVLRLAERALGGRTLLEQVTADGIALYAVTGVFSAADALAANDALLTDALADARRRGSIMGFANALYARSWPRLYAGRLADAAADAERAIGARDDGWRAFLPAAYAVLLETLVEREELEAAAATAADAVDQLGTPDGPTWMPFLIARGRARALAGDPDGALEDLLLCGRLAPEVANPAVVANWRGLAAVLLARAGDVERAAALAEEELAAARAFGAPRALAGALRARALVAAQVQDGAIPLLEEAAAVTTGSEARLEHGHVLVELGAALRRAGRRRDAGRRLGEALETSRALGAGLVERRAADELSRSGTATRRAAESGAGALSPSERRVAQLAVEGMSNREIAEQLFVTRKTIEFHLRNAYLKLGIASRKELRQVLL